MHRPPGHRDPRPGRHRGPGLTEFAAQVETQRAIGTAATARHLASRFELRTGLTEQTAADILWTLAAPGRTAAPGHEVRSWLSTAALDIPSDLGLADQIEAATASGISLELIENSYSADVCQVTWRPNNPDPEGAT